MNQGWIKLHRQLQDCYLWEDKPFNQGCAWVDLLLMANHKDTKIMFDGRPLQVNTGSFVTSTRKLAERWGWSRGKVTRFLSSLQNEGMIEFEMNTKRTAISIVNYSKFQDVQTTDEPQTSHRRATDEPQTNINKNDKNVKNVKNNTIRSVFFPDNETLDNEFREYVEHRKAIKKPFKTDHSVELAINNLMELANGNSDKAVLIIQQSIRQGWQGLFELKDQKAVPQYKQFSHSKELTDLEKELLSN